MVVVLISCLAPLSPASSAPPLKVVHEPVEEWQRVPSVGGNTLNLLDKFYSDPEKYAYTFQNYVFMSRVMQVRWAVQHTVCMARGELSGIHSLLPVVSWAGHALLLFLPILCV